MEPESLSTESKWIFPREAGPEDFEGIARLMNQTFGENPRIRSALGEWRELEEASLLIAKNGCEVVGVAAGRILPATELFPAFGSRVEEFLGRHRTAHVFSLAVAPSFRRQGLATRLSGEILRRLRAFGPSAFSGIHWASGSPDNSESLFRDFGFRVLGLSETHRGEEARANGHACAVCGPECRCLSVFYGADAADVIRRLG